MSNGRGDWTRTSDHTAPSRAFYQLNYAPRGWEYSKGETGLYALGESACLRDHVSLLGESGVL